MTEPKDHGCPECGAPRGADHTPSCACTQRASEALRDAREAQVAAAEDFDPLRIRPYVELDGAPEPEPSSTMPLRTPLSEPPAEPNVTDIRLFEAPSSPPEPGPQERPRGRRRTVVLLGAAAAMVGVVAAAGMASGLFSYETPTRDTALPEAVRASVPDPTPSDEPKRTPKSTSPSPTSASPTPSATESESPSPSASSTSATPSSTTQTPTQSPTPARASDAPPAETTPDPDPPVLRRGDKGPEVSELQLRLRQLYLYNGDINGNFNQPLEEALKNYQWSRGVGADNLGVYDAETRASLESETSEP